MVFLVCGVGLMFVRLYIHAGHRKPLPDSIYQECRFVPRVRDRPNGQSNRRPHLNVDCWNENLICYCSRCDEGVERGLPLRISKYCDCDQYKRWICLYCKKKEDDATKSYYDTCVKYE